MFTSLTKCGCIKDIRLGLSWDAAALGHEVDRRAAVLSQMGIGRGSVVAIAHSGSAHFFADLFATWRVGAAAACLDPTLTPRELQTVVRFAKAAVLLVDHGALGAPGALDNFPVPIRQLDRARPAGISPGIATLHPDDPALVLFTSGTTGAPKGVVLSFRALTARITANIAAIGTAALARALVTLPTHFGHGLIGNSLTPLFAGGDIVLPPLGMPLAHDLGRIIDEHNITFMTAVPTFWRAATSYSRPPSGNSLVRVHVGSAPLSAALWSEIAAWTRAEAVNCYGITETANWIAGASSRIDGIAEGLAGNMWDGAVAIMDDEGSIRSTGAGEIVVQSAALMSGYLDRPDLTAAAFKSGWFLTGDSGSLDAQGRIWLTGRIKDEINRAGFKVQPAEIDALLDSHPAIAEACVFGINDATSGEAVAAAIRLAKGASASSESLAAWCRERVRRGAIPEHWFFVADIPRTARGKVSRDEVRRMLAKNMAADAVNSGVIGLSHAQQAPADTSVVRKVRDAVEQAWTKVLNRHSFAADVAWNVAGGDSLQTLRLWFLLEEILGRRLSLDLFEPGATPRHLAEAIEQQLRKDSSRPARDRLASKTPVVFFMPPATGDLPILASFRAAFEGKIRFVTIEYPGWQEMLAAGSRLESLLDAAVAQIYAEGGQNGVYLLAGYSFGGFVALETARRLVGDGGRVGFLGLIDTRYTSPPRARRSLLVRTGRTLRSIFIEPGEMLSLVPRRIIAALLRMSAFPVLRSLGRLAMLLSPKAAFALHWELITQLRTKSLRRTMMKPLQIPVTLFRTDERSEALPDYGWGALCRPLAVIPIGGAHLTLFEPSQRAQLCARFLEAVEAACAVPAIAPDRSDQRAYADEPPRCRRQSSGGH